MSEKISELNVTPIKPSNGLVGFANLIYDNNFFLGSIGIYSRPTGGYRLTYPTLPPRRDDSIKQLNYFYPINKEIALAIENAVTEKFNTVIGSYTTINSNNKVINKSQAKTIYALIGENKTLESMIIDHYSITNIDSLPADSFDHCLDNCLKVLKAKFDIDSIKNAFSKKEEVYDRS